jgi:hypothetical protein
MQNLPGCLEIESATQVDSEQLNMLKNLNECLCYWMGPVHLVMSSRQYAAKRCSRIATLGSHHRSVSHDWFILQIELAEPKVEQADDHLPHQNLEHQFVMISKKIKLSCLEFGRLYTRSQGHCSTQIKHSHWYKSWNQPEGLYITLLQMWAPKYVPILLCSIPMP